MNLRDYKIEIKFDSLNHPFWCLYKNNDCIVPDVSEEEMVADVLCLVVRRIHEYLSK